MTRLVFIRHAETDMAGSFCGHSDPSISSRGQEQIINLIANLGSEPFDAIYSSDLQRAIDTAKPLGQIFRVPVETTPRLREIFFGDWEALTWTEIEERDAQYARRWIKTFPALSAPNGESYEAFESRVLAEINHLIVLAEGKRIAVITHGGVMRLVLRNLLGYDDPQAWNRTKLYCSTFVYARPVNEQGVRQ